MGILVLLGVSGLLWLTYTNYKRNSTQNSSTYAASRPIEILQMRFARGEIDREEYERLKVEIDY